MMLAFRLCSSGHSAPRRGRVDGEERLSVDREERLSVLASLEERSDMAFSGAAAKSSGCRGLRWKTQNGDSLFEDD